MWQCELKKTTLKLTPKQIKEFKLFRKKKVIGCVDIQDDGSLSISSDSMEHYPSIVHEIAPFINEYKIEGELIFIDIEYGIVKYIFKNGSLFEKNLRYDENKFSKRAKIVTQTIEESLSYMTELLSITDKKSEQDISILNRYNSKDEYVKTIIQENDYHRSLDDFSVESLKKEFKDYDFDFNSVKYYLNDNFKFCCKNKIVNKYLTDYFKEDLSKLKAKKKKELDKENAIKLKDEMLQSDKSYNLKLDQFIELFNYHYMKNINKSLPDCRRLETTDNLWIKKRNVYILNPTEYFLWSYHNDDGTYCSDVWEDSSWYEWDEEFCEIEYLDDAFKYKDSDPDYKVINTFVSFLNKFGIQYKLEKGSKYHYRKFKTVLVLYK